MHTPNHPAASLALLDRDDTAILLVDHQTGLLQAVGDIPLRDLRANVAAIARLATFYKIPVISTTSVATGPNGPLIPEIMEHAPHAVEVPRAGEIDAWDSAAFRAAVEATGRKTLVIAGILTSVCVAFPALSATAAGYRVFAVMDASGDYSDLSSRTTLAHLSANGVHTISTFSMISQVHETWLPDNTPTLASIYAMVVPGYAAVLESYYAPRE